MSHPVVYGSKHSPSPLRATHHRQISTKAQRTKSAEQSILQQGRQRISEELSSYIPLVAAVSAQLEGSVAPPLFGEHPRTGRLPPSAHAVDTSDENPLVSFPTRRQQPPQSPSPHGHHRQATSRSSSSTRTLRRTPRLEDLHPTRARSVSVDSLRRPILGEASQPPPLSTLSDPPYTAQLDLSTGPQTSPTADNPEPRPSEPQDRPGRISRRTASAIRYALEEAIRSPFPFTPDLEEENATMADLVAGGMPNSAGGYNGRTTANGHSRAGGPVPVPSAAVRGPREVMRDREAREARKKAESEARERQEQENLRRGQEDRRRSVDRRTAAVAAGVAGGEGATYRRASGAEVDRGGPSTAAADAAPVAEGRVQGVVVPVTAAGAVPSGRAVTSGATRPRAGTGGAYNPRPVQPPPTSTAPNATRGSGPPPPPAKPTTTTGAAPTGAPTGPSAAAPSRPGVPAADGTTRNPNVSSFPHAFERWETLSSQWEGLTSYWIRRLEQNREEVSREPLSQQMSRQITDLSAAGANLFHAVVELQRLRASSERKFQRWFFETRAEQERAREIQAELEENLRRERDQRTAAVQEAARLTTENANAEKRLGEMRRELAISKEEARRAWEELGRREQDERERTDSLRDGQPTVIRGIQVVPMTQAGLSRGGSVNRPTTGEGLYSGTTTMEHLGGGESPEGRRYDAGPVEGYGGTMDRRPISNPDDPFVERSQQVAAEEQYLPHERSDVAPPGLPVTNGTSSRGRDRGAYASTSSTQPPMARPVQTSRVGAGGDGAPVGRGGGGLAGDQPTFTGGPSSFYQHQGTSIHSPSYVSGPPRDHTRSAGSVPSEEGTVSEEDYEIDEHGQFRLDAEGRPIVYRRGGDYGGRGAGYASGSLGPVVTTGGAGWSGSPADYSGAGYGSGGWENLSRHHHPTRLSDVQEEEDERSRTSMSSRR